jgi:hypothetical protein
MEAFIHSYVRKDRESLRRFVQAIIQKLFKRNDDPAFWSSMLACSKWAMGINITTNVLQSISSILAVPRQMQGHEIIEHYRQTALPRLLTMLETKLAGVVHVAYTGREPGSNILPELNLILDYWAIKPLLTSKINTGLSIPKQGDSYYVTDFQRLLLCSFTNQFFELLCREDLLFFKNLETVAIRIEREGKCILVKIRISLLPHFSIEECEEIADILRSSPDYKKWESSTIDLLPRPMSLQFRKERRDILLVFPLWESAVKTLEEWKWRTFYSYVVENTWGENELSRLYYWKAEECMQDALPITPEKITNYTLVQLDGLFVHTYTSSLKILESVPHTIKNVLKHLSDPRLMDEDELAVTAIEIQRLNKTLLGIGPIALKEFDIEGALSNLLRECRVFYPSIDFQMQEGLSDKVVTITGSRDHILTAIRDVIHNSVDALRQMDKGKPRNIRIKTLQTDYDVEIVIENTGQASAHSKQMSFGIGSRTVNEIVCGLHKGRVSHGPIDSGSDFQFEWRLFFPLYSLGEEA